MYVCICLWVCMYLRPEVNLWWSEGAAHPVFWDRVSHWPSTCLSRLGWPTTRLQGACLLCSLQHWASKCPPHAWLSHGFFRFARQARNWLSLLPTPPLFFPLNVNFGWVGLLNCWFSFSIYLFCVCIIGGRSCTKVEAWENFEELTFSVWIPGMEQVSYPTKPSPQPPDIIKPNLAMVFS